MRASFLKPYLLRLRAEKGERAVRQALSAAEIEGSAIDSETGWISFQKARRALSAIKEVLGDDALRIRGEWAVHAETLGTYVRMLRVAKHPVDAYRYLAANAREVTRVGDWELEEFGGKKGDAELTRVRMSYRIRADAEDVQPKDEGVLCLARQGELISFPRLWGHADAKITHPSCLAKGDDACIYEIEWTQSRSRRAPLFAGIASVVGGGAAFLIGGVPGGVLGLFGSGLFGFVAGFLFDQTKNEAAARIFERHRILALERGLELKGDSASSGSISGDIVGTVLGGKYRIGRKIGAGGIGAVYAAEHMVLGHEVAVKVLRGAAARDGSEIARLRREAYIQVHLEHPSIARVFDLDQMPDGSIFVVMERLHGKSLAERLGRGGVLAPGEAVAVFGDVCEALAAAHVREVVHRDLKPGNIFLCDDGVAKVLDFGMSKLATAESLTQEGFTLGTPEYMAPEQCIGADVVPETDLYSLGVVMYEALTGELPITSPNRRDLLDLHQRRIPLSMREKRKDLAIPEQLDAIVMMCLRKKIEDRPRSAKELAKMLRAIPREGLLMSYPASTVRRVEKEKGDKSDDVAKLDAVASGGHTLPPSGTPTLSTTPSEGKASSAGSAAKANPSVPPSSDSSSSHDNSSHRDGPTVATLKSGKAIVEEPTK